MAYICTKFGLLDLFMIKINYNRNKYNQSPGWEWKSCFNRLITAKAKPSAGSLSWIPCAEWEALKTGQKETGLTPYHIGYISMNIVFNVVAYRINTETTYIFRVIICCTSINIKHQGCISRYLNTILLLRIYRYYC